jgi:hypothetical protein
MKSKSNSTTDGIIHNNTNQDNIETRFASRAKSIFAAFGTIANDFYLEAGIYFVGGFNASLVAWDIYTDLLTKNQPLLYAITLGIIAFIAVEGLAVYLVGAAAKTNNGPLWFFSVIFATFFTYAHYQEITYNAGIISQYIMLAVPFFVVVGYWARTVKTDVEHKLAEIEDELAREQKIEDEERARKQKLEDEERARQRQIEDETRAHEMAIEAQREDAKIELKRLKAEAQREVSMTLKNTNSTNLARVTPNFDTINDTRKIDIDTRRKKVQELLEGDIKMTYGQIADDLDVSLATIKRDVKSLNGKIRE